MWISCGLNRTPSPTNSPSWTTFKALGSFSQCILSISYCGDQCRGRSIRTRTAHIAAPMAFRASYGRPHNTLQSPLASEPTSGPDWFLRMHPAHLPPAPPLKYRACRHHRSRHSLRDHRAACPRRGVVHRRVRPLEVTPAAIWPCRRPSARIEVSRRSPASGSVAHLPQRQ